MGEGQVPSWGCLYTVLGVVVGQARGSPAARDSVYELNWPAEASPGQELMEEPPPTDFD